MTFYSYSFLSLMTDDARVRGGDCSAECLFDEGVFEMLRSVSFTGVLNPEIEQPVSSCRWRIPRPSPACISMRHLVSRML